MTYSNETTEMTQTPSSAWQSPRPPQRRRSAAPIVFGVLAVVLALGLAIAAGAYLVFDYFETGMQDAKAQYEKDTLGHKTTVTTAVPAGGSQSSAVGTGSGSASRPTAAGTASGPAAGPGPGPAAHTGDATIPVGDRPHTETAPVVPEPEITSFGPIGLDSCGPGHDDRVMKTLVWTTRNATRVELVYPGGATHDVAPSGSADVYAFCGVEPGTYTLNAYNGFGHVQSRRLDIAV